MCWDLTSELFRKHILFVSKNGLQILSTFHHSPSVYLNLAARNKVWGSFPFGWVFVSLLLDGSKGVRKGLGLTPPWAWQFKTNFITWTKEINCFRILFACKSVQALIALAVLPIYVACCASSKAAVFNKEPFKYLIMSQQGKRKNKSLLDVYT